MLNGIGFVTIARLDRANIHHPLAPIQSVWVAISIGVFVLTLLVVRDVHVFERYRYTVALLGVAALAASPRARDRAHGERRPPLGRA